MEKKKDIENAFNLYIKDVFRYSAYKLNNRSLAEDVSQEVFVRLMSKDNLESFQLEKPYLIGMARNIIYEKFRSENKTDSIDQIEEAGIDLPNEEVNLENLTLDSESVDLIKSYLDNLDEQTKEAIILKIWEDLEFKQIASIQSSSESAVKLRYYRGLEKIKVLLGERSSSKKLYSFNLPVIIFGISQIAKSSAFTLSPAFVAQATGMIGITANLILNSLNMTNNVGNVATSGVSAGGGIFSSLLAKLGLGVTTVALASSLAAGGYIAYNNSTDNNSDITDQSKNESSLILESTDPYLGWSTYDEAGVFSVKYDTAKFTLEDKIEATLGCSVLKLNDTTRVEIGRGQGNGANNLDYCIPGVYPNTDKVSNYKIAIDGKEYTATKFLNGDNSTIAFSIPMTAINDNLDLTFFFKETDETKLVPEFELIAKSIVTKSVDTTSWKTYNIKHSLFNTNIDLKYPSDWEVRVENNGRTYAFVAPSGSALGFDINDQSVMDCGTEKATDLSSKSFAFRRYFDDKKYSGVNWLVCTYNSRTNKFDINTANQFTILAKSDSDLIIIDEMLRSAENKASLTNSSNEFSHFSSPNWDFSFDYPKSFGDVNYKNNYVHPDKTNYWFCSSDNVTFTSSPIVVSAAEGAGDCIGIVGAPNEVGSVTSKDGKEFRFNRYDHSGGITLTAYYYSTFDNNFLNSQRVFLSVIVKDENEMNTTKEFMTEIIESMKINFPNKGKFKDFDNANLKIKGSYPDYLTLENPSNDVMTLKSKDGNSSITFMKVFPSGGANTQGGFSVKDFELILSNPNLYQVVSCKEGVYDSGSYSSKISYASDLYIIYTIKDKFIRDEILPTLVGSLQYYGSSTINASCSATL